MSADLQTAWQVTMPSGTLDGHMLVILAIMVIAGMLGGTANYYLSDRQHEAGRREWGRYAVFGVVAALTVPLFLNMIASTLLEGARTRPIDFYVFAGFCLIYVIASRRLFENVLQRLFGQLEQVRRDVGQLRQQQRDEVPQPARGELIDTPRTVEPDVRENLSYSDIEILRALSEENVVYGNLSALCDATGLARDLVSQRLTVLKALGIIETRITDKNLLHWIVSLRGKELLAEILNGQDLKKTA